MALQNKILQLSCRSVLGEVLNKRFASNSRALLKSATSESLRICATGQETFPEDLITPGASAEVVAKETRIKSLKEMPGPSAVSNLIEFFYRDGFSRIHEIQMEHSQKYGKIFKSRFGPQLVVSIAGRDLVAEVLRTEGVAPQRGNMESWKEYRDLRGRSTGLISAEGEDWLKMRSILRQLIMRPKDVAQFSDDVNAVVEDLVKRVDTLRSQQSDGLTVLNINDLFFKYAMEGMAAILYEDRLGCLENEIPQKSQDYIAALHLMFSSFKMTMYAGAIPKWLRTVTSFTLSWACYLLARHPEVQQEIYEEVTRTLGHGTIPTADDVPRLPLIRGLVKETLRMFPVLPGNGRVTQDDLVVGGYFIPKGDDDCTQLALCHYSTSMDEENFPGADDFRPDRWIRKDATDRVDNFGSIPFGYGIRSCIGRRIAELEMHLALTQKKSLAKTHGLLCPAAPINLQFADRQNP
uniref:Cytochrome P450 27C1 n=1 Tax=Oncorhynchus tshawytscha TaxID=74940 RepID=A0AAZ3QHV8_ONCTS